MNAWTKLFALGLMILSGFLTFRNGPYEGAIRVAKGERPWPRTVTSSSQPRSPSSSLYKATPAPDKSALSANEVESLKTLVAKFQRFSKAGTNPREFLSDLERDGLHAITSEQHNEETGRKYFIRTENALEGTRYMHAQFVEDESGATILQHISFEIRPSESSMASAIQIAQQTFQFSEKPATRTQNFVEWHRNGRTLWIKKIDDPRELSSDMFNARSPEDQGVVMIALEIDPHAHNK